VRRGAGAAGGADKNVRIRQGVADTVAEATLLAGCGRVENASELYAAAQASGAAWATLARPQDLPAAGLELEPDALSRVGQDVAAGYVVIVPKRPARADGRETAAWWRVDPVTGQTLGIGRQGWGESMTEYAFLVARLLLKGALFLKCMGAAIGNTGAALLCTFIFFAGSAALAAGGAVGNVLAIMADMGSLAK
jgi:hypothetical protein